MRSIFIVLLMSVGVAQAHGLPSFSQLAEDNKPAVVNISTTRIHKATNSHRQFEFPEGAEDGPLGEMLRRFYGVPPGGSSSGGRPGSETHSLGSGFIISKDGFIVTNHHVINGADEIVVRLDDRNEFNAELIGSDPRSDIALLKINANNLPIIKKGDSNKLKVGEWVLAIGSPFGFDHTVTAGIVSAKQRSLPSDSYVPFIQTDVAINPGNSGGPLFNLAGEVVGVNSQIVSGSGGYMGLSFAVPIDLALDVVEQLKSKGHVSRAWLGVLIQEITRELAESFQLDKPQGALVSSVLPGSPAKQGGIVSGDIILEFDGQSINEHSDLPPLVGKFEIGKSAKVKVLRNGKFKTLNINMGELPDDNEVASVQPSSRKEPGEDTRLGLVVQSLSQEIRQQSQIAEGGVEVVQVKGSSAVTAGIRQGDIITSINNQPVQNVDDFLSKLDALKVGSSVALLVQRKDGPIFLALRIPQNDR